MPTELIKDCWTVQDRVYPDGWWLKKYWESTHGPHRDTIIRALEMCPDWHTLFEVGCNVGPNLRRIHQRWPQADLAGMDVHAGSIAYGRKQAKEEGWYWSGYCGDVRDVGLIGPAAADVILSCYTLAYLDPRDIYKVLGDLLTSARTAVVIAEPQVGRGEEIRYAAPRRGVIPEYHHGYQDVVEGLREAQGASWKTFLLPVHPPEGRLQTVLVVLKT